MVCEESETREVGVYEDNMMLIEPDWEGKAWWFPEEIFLTIVDEEGVLEAITVAVTPLPHVSISP